LPLITVVLYIAYKDEFKLAYEKLKVRFDEKARKRTRRAVESLETITDMCTDPFIDDLDGHESIDGRNFHYLIVPGKYFLLVKMGVTSLSSEALAKRYKYSLGRGINIYAYEIKNGESINNDDNNASDDDGDDDDVNEDDDDDDDNDNNYEDNATADYNEDGHDGKNVYNSDYFIYISNTNRIEEDYSRVVNI
jgi:hypothetical protein